MDKQTIKAILLNHGFTVNSETNDLKPYVYEAIEAVITEYERQKQKNTIKSLMAEFKLRSLVHFCNTGKFL